MTNIADNIVNMDEIVTRSILAEEFRLFEERFIYKIRAEIKTEINTEMNARFNEFDIKFDRKFDKLEEELKEQIKEQLRELKDQSKEQLREQREDHRRQMGAMLENMDDRIRAIGEHMSGAYDDIIVLKKQKETHEEWLIDVQRRMNLLEYAMHGKRSG